MSNSDKERIDSLEQQLDIKNKLEEGKNQKQTAWMEDGEKASKFFFDLEWKKQSAACITKLISGNRAVSVDRDILDVAQAFYQELYTDELVNIALQDKLFDPLDKRLSNSEQLTCEGPVTRPELDASIKKMNLNKSPGPDGLTTEFYRTF